MLSDIDAVSRKVGTNRIRMVATKNFEMRQGNLKKADLSMTLPPPSVSFVMPQCAFHNCVVRSLDSFSMRAEVDEVKF